MYCTKSSHNSDLSNINYNNCINIQHELFLRVYRRRCSRLYSKIRYIHPTSLRSSSKQKPCIYWTVKENESKHLNTIMCIIQNKTRNVLQSFFTKILNSTSLFGLFEIFMSLQYYMYYSRTHNGYVRYKFYFLWSHNLWWNLI